MDTRALSVGSRFRSGPGRLGGATLDPNRLLPDDLRGSRDLGWVLGPAVATSLWRVTDVADGDIVRNLEERWSFERPVPSQVDLLLDATVVRVGDGPSPDTRAVTFHRELTSEDGDVIVSGTLTAAVRAGAATRDDHRDVGTPAWGALLGDALAADRAFGSAVASWDGTIGLRGGQHEVHLRIYRGRVIDVTERSPHGATFTLSASDLTWTRFLTTPDGGFSSRLMSGEFISNGDPYEYLRLTKAIEIIAETARQLAGPGDAPEGPA